MTPKWNDFNSQIARLRRDRYIEGGNSPLITYREKDNKRDFQVGFTFWGQWSVNIKFVEEEPGLIISARHQIVQELYHAFHFHPKMVEPNIEWKCLPCYENGPHFHLYLDREQKVMADREIMPLLPFLLFIASRHHGSEERFGLFRREYCKGYDPCGMVLIPSIPYVKNNVI